jgi:hypothetical protein
LAGYGNGDKLSHIGAKNGGFSTSIARITLAYRLLEFRPKSRNFPGFSLLKDWNL